MNVHKALLFGIVFLPLFFGIALAENIFNPNSGDSNESLYLILASMGLATVGGYLYLNSTSNSTRKQNPTTQTIWDRTNGPNDVNKKSLPTMLGGTLGTLAYEINKIIPMWKIFRSDADEFTYNGNTYIYNPDSHTVVLKDGVTNPSISTLHTHDNLPYHTNIRYGSQNYHVEYDGDPASINTKYLDYRTVTDNKLEDVKLLGETEQLTESSARSIANDVVNPGILPSDFLSGLGEVVTVSLAISAPYRAYQVYTNQSTPGEALLDIGEDVTSAGVGYAVTETCLGVGLAAAESGPGAILAFAGCMAVGGAAGYTTRTGMEYVENNIEAFSYGYTQNSCYIQMNTKQTISSICDKQSSLPWNNTYEDTDYGQRY